MGRILRHPALLARAIPFILETPIDRPGDDLRNMKAARRLATATGPTKSSSKKRSARKKKAKAKVKRKTKRTKKKAPATRRASSRKKNSAKSRTKK